MTSSNDLREVQNMTHPFAKADQPEEEGIPRYDSKNRYLIPDPDRPDKTARWTRATNFAKTISETDGLQRWAERMVVQGMAKRPDLLAQATRTHNGDWRNNRAFDQIAKEAKSAAGAWDRARYGTTIHSLTERVDLGDLDPLTLDPPWGAMIRAYAEVMQTYQVQILPEYIERTVIVKRYKVAGTFDRVVRMPNGELWIADLKTGRNLDYNWGEISIQLALYANADKIWDYDTQQFLDMPEVNREQGLIIHTPVNGTEVALYRINLAQGWAAAELCDRVRNWRKFKGLSALVGKAEVEQPAVVPWEDQIRAAASIEDLSTIWQEATKAGEWTKDLEALGMIQKEEIER